MSEKRSVQRPRTFLKAEVDLNGISSLACIVRDLTATGARLTLSEGVVLPDSFRLRLAKPGRWMTVQMRWRRGESVGISFEPEAAQDLGLDAMADRTRIRQLETELARLRKVLEELREDPSKLHLLLDGAF